MDYGFGKTYVVPEKFHALNGALQEFVVSASVKLVASEDASAKDVAEAQANYLRVLEVLRTVGGQPVVVKAEGKKLSFSLEQPNAFGESGPIQVSAHNEDIEAEVKAKFAEIFKNVKPIVLKADAEGNVLGEDVEAEAKAKDLFVDVEVESAF